MFAVVGLAALAVAMRVDYRAYRNEKFIYGVLGGVGLMLVAVLFTHRSTAHSAGSAWAASVFSHPSSPRLRACC